MIELPSKPSDSLDWSKELAQARSESKIVWKFNLGLEDPFFPLEEEMRFQSNALALKQFTDSVWPEFEANTDALILYRGSGDFAELFRWSEKQQANYEEWLLEQERDDSAEAKKLFAADAFAIYFQMLSHRLPDEAKIFLLFDVRSFKTVSEALQVISKERFTHFAVALRDRGLPLDGWVWDEKGIAKRHVDKTIGIVFPEDRSFAEKFDALLTKRSDVKIVFESFLTEEWDGLDELIVLKDSMGMRGERKLKGFLAAGGKIAWV